MKTRTMSLLRTRSAKATVFVILCLLTGAASAEEWKSAAPIPQGAEEVYGIAADGKLYVFGGLGLEWKAVGMVMEYDPARDRWRRKQDMSFANGVALSKDEQSLFVNETGKYRVWKIAVESDNLDVTRGAPQAVVLFDNLPGYPDNLMRGLDGKIWLGFAKPRNPSADAVADKPFLRKLALRLPRALWPVPVTYGHVLAFTEDGNVVADLQDPLAPTRTRPASPKPRTGSTCRACMLTGLAGYPAENALLPACG